MMGVLWLIIDEKAFNSFLRAYRDTVKLPVEPPVLDLDFQVLEDYYDSIIGLVPRSYRPIVSRLMDDLLVNKEKFLSALSLSDKWFTRLVHVFFEDKVRRFRPEVPGGLLSGGVNWLNVAKYFPVGVRYRKTRRGYLFTPSENDINRVDSILWYDAEHLFHNILARNVGSSVTFSDDEHSVTISGRTYTFPDDSGYFYALDTIGAGRHAEELIIKKVIGAFPTTLRGNIMYSRGMWDRVVLRTRLGVLEPSVPPSLRDRRLDVAIIALPYKYPIVKVTFYPRVSGDEWFIRIDRLMDGLRHIAKTVAEGLSSNNDLVAIDQ